MHKEIEIKIRLNRKEENILKNWVNSNAKFIGDLKIIDYYFNLSKRSFYSDKEYKEIFNFLRLRVSNKDSFITYKNRKIDENGNTVSVNEIETKVDDGSKVIEIFKQLNFSEIVEITKKRSIYIYDFFEIVFDNVKSLGNFIEIELKDYLGEVEDGIQKIYSLLQSIGIKSFIKYDRGYITMFLNPNYNFGQEINF